ncbi:MAG: alkaline phosphatase family protein [Victivallales bacterium]|nr:alkaline phosphatase family protein [Victivallales bacterium]
MKNHDVHIFVFIDALGWEIIRSRPFLNDLLPWRYPVEMQFGYSSTALPTILTGVPPTVHKHLSFYYYAPEHSPFRMLRRMKFALRPGGVFNSRRMRHVLSRLFARFYDFTGYFEMSAMPFERLPYFDYVEKTDIFAPGGLAPVRNLADELQEWQIPAYISDWRCSESDNFAALRRQLGVGRIRFAFMYTAMLDRLLHDGPASRPGINRLIDWYEAEIRQVVAAAQDKYRRYTLHVMSDHGMTPLVGSCDVRSMAEAPGLRFGSDFAAVYDSTMARFWFFNPVAREQIMARLCCIRHAHVLTEEEKRRYRIDFPDHMYGEEILLLDPGWLVAPSDMAKGKFYGMHGYAPEHAGSMAGFLASEPVMPPPVWVGDYHTLMRQKMECIVNE